MLWALLPAHGSPVCERHCCLERLWWPPGALGRWAAARSSVKLSSSVATSWPCLRPLLPSRGQCLVSVPMPACHVTTRWAALNWDPGSYSLSPAENSEAVSGGGGDTGSKTRIIPLLLLKNNYTRSPYFPVPPASVPGLKPGEQGPSTKERVLRGMQGSLWIRSGVKRAARRASIWPSLSARYQQRHCTEDVTWAARAKRVMFPSAWALMKRS